MFDTRRGILTLYDTGILSVRELQSLARVSIIGFISDTRAHRTRIR